MKCGTFFSSITAGGPDWADVGLSTEAGTVRLNTNWDEGQLDWDGQPIPDNRPDKYGHHGIDLDDPDLIDAEVTIPGGPHGTWALHYLDAAFRVYLADGTPLPSDRNMPGTTGGTIPLKIEAITSSSPPPGTSAFTAYYYDDESDGYAEADIGKFGGDLGWSNGLETDPTNAEEAPGKFIRLSDGSNALWPLKLSAFSDYRHSDQYVALGFTDNLKIWSSPNRTGEITSATHFALANPFTNAFDTTVYIEGIAAAAGGEDSQVWLSWSGSGTDAARALDRVFVSVVDADLDIMGVEDVDELSPGGYVGLNDDNDDGDAWLDYLDPKIFSDDVEVDDDLVELQLNPVAGADSSGLYTLSFPNTLNVWLNQNRTGQVVSDGPIGNFNQEATKFLAGAPTSIWVEAASLFNALLINANWKNAYAGFSAMDVAAISSVSVDIEIDGLNSRYEMAPYVGAYVQRNTDFSKNNVSPDAELVPDYEPNGMLNDYTFDPQYERDYTPAQITWSDGAEELFDLRLTFPTNILVWNATDWNHVGNPLRLLPGGIIPISDIPLTLWIEGLAASSQLGGDAIKAELVTTNTARTPLAANQARYNVVEVNAGVDGDRDGDIDVMNLPKVRGRWAWLSKG